MLSAVRHGRKKRLSRVKRNPLWKLGNAIAIILIMFLLGATCQLGIEKRLVGSVGVHEWGRYLFGIGAALTQSRWGITGYVIDNTVEQKLQIRGLTDNLDMLKALGVKFPDNLRDERLLQGALETARVFDVPPAATGDYERLRGSGGDDIGLAIYTSLAFFLFGFKVSVLYYTYFALLGLTVLLFVISHHRSPISMTCLLLMVLSLYLLVVSDIVNFTRALPTYSGQPGSDIKDPRFFGTIAAFPALHLLLTWMRRKPAAFAFD